jgi:group I intron endonuclease
MKISGIYKIQSLIKPERIYIGSAVDMSKRWREHLSTLKKDKHDNLRLQNHYNKYGSADLQFSILLGCDKEYLIANEQFFIDSYKPFFNICLKAGNTFGRKHSEETKQKIKEKRKYQIIQSPSVETRDKISKANKGKIITDECRRKISISNTGKIRSDDFKKRASITHLGNKNSLGYKHDKAFCDNISIRNKGKKFTEEHKRKISLSLMGHKPTKIKKLKTA